MIFFFLTFNLAFFCWLFLIKGRLKGFSHAYSFVVSALLFVYVSISVYLISFRDIRIEGSTYYGGIDAPAYKEIYELANTSYIESILVQFYEPGYATIVWFFSRFIGSYEIYQIFIYGFLYFTLLFIVKKVRPNIFIFITVFLLSFSIISSMNILRVTFAIYIGFYVFNFLSKQRFLSATLLCLVAVSIHISALILFVIVFFEFIRRKFSSSIYYLAYASCFTAICFVSFVLLPVLLEGFRIGFYGQNDGEFSLNTFAIASIVTFLCFNRYKEMVMHNSFNATLIGILPTIFFILPVFYNYPIAYRFLLYYLPVIFLILPSLFHVYRPTLRKNIAYLPAVSLVYLYVGIKIYVFYAVEVDSAKVFQINIVGGLF